MVCQNCRKEAPTWNVTFYRVIGLVAGFSYKRIAGHLCENCINKFFEEYTLTTLFFGWWSLISFVLTPAFIINNLWMKIQIKRLPKPVPHPKVSPLSDAVLAQLRPFREEILERIHFKQRLDMIVPSIASRAKVTTAEVDRYIQTEIAPEVLFGARSHTN